MKSIFSIVDIVYRQLTERDHDTLWIIAGDEGSSKTNLALHLKEYWTTKHKGKCDPEEIDKVSLTGKDFINSLQNSKKYDALVFDEAGALSNRRAMSKFNVILNQAFMVIRGDNMFVILCLPDLFQLESYFVKHRARGFIYVYGRGKFGFWDKEKLHRLVSMNENRFIKSYKVVRPLFRDTFPMYKGVLKEQYDILKKNKIAETKATLNEDINEDGKKKEKVELSETDKVKQKLNKKNEVVIAMDSMGCTPKEIASQTRLSVDRIKDILNGKIGSF